MKRDSRIIAIAGGGIAGLTCALLLEKQGFRVHLLERDSKPATTGTGIQLSPNAFHILESIGLSKVLLAAGFSPDYVDIRSGITGGQLTKFQLGHDITARHDAPYIVIHRIDLSNALRNACKGRSNIEIKDGHKVTDLAAHPNGVTMMCEHEGKPVEFRSAAVVGADGVWSNLRQFVHKASKPKFTGRIAWRTVVNMDDVPEALPRNATGLWLGPNAHLVHYPLRQGSMMNIIAVTPWANNEPPPRGWLSEEDSGERTNSFQNWQPLIQALMKRNYQWGGWPLNAVPRVGRSVNGPLCLIGDAAHAMVPFGAQGGASAIEDAAVLALECARTPTDLEAAFARVEKLRKPRVRKIIELGHDNRRIYHMARPASSARDMVMQRTPQALMQKRMDWLYGWRIGSLAK